MKNQNLVFICLIGILIGSNSCTHYYYAPNAHNVPLFQEKNEARINIAQSAGDEFEGIEVQSAFSITKNIGIMANGFFVTPQDGNSWGKGKFGEFGIGYFKAIDKKIVFEFYGGVGLGKVENQYSLASVSTVQFMRNFIQPSIGLTTKWFDIAISSRFGWLKFYNLKYNNIEANFKEDLIFLDENRASFLVEPAITIRGGWKYIKIQTQLGLSRNLTNPQLMQEEINLNVGLYITIANKYRS